MKGRSWRHFSIFWPFMVAGALGPREAPDPDASIPDGAAVAPTGDMPRAGRVDSDPSASDDDSHWQSAADGEGTEADTTLRGTLGRLPGPNVVSTQTYVEVFWPVPLHDAVLYMFCVAARLGSALFGDNVADTTALTEKQIADMEADAHVLGVDCVHTLY